MTKRSKSDEDEQSPHEGAVEGAVEAAVEGAVEASPPPAKKTKKSTEEKTEKKATKPKKASSSGGKKGNVGKNVFTNSEGEKFVDLGKKKRVTVRSFKGSTLVDIREFYGDDDDLKPGKKGISLSVEQWAELRSNAGTIDSLILKT